MVVTAEEGGFVVCEVILKNGLANFFGEADDEAEVVDGGEVIIFAFLLDVARTPECAETPTRPAGATSGAIATVVKGGARVGEFAEVEGAVAGVDFAMAGFAGGGHTVESVGAHFGTNENVVGMRQAEQVTRLICGKFLVAPAEDFTEVFFEKSATETITVKTDAVNL